jgi:hypothetical protein
LLENGHLVRAATSTVEEWDWDGNLVWAFEYIDDPPVHPHHDVEVLPNGNVLILAWEEKSADEAIANGRDPETMPTGQLWPEHLVEVQPAGADGGVIVWEWHVWDHLIQDFDATKANFGVVADHPELMDINYPEDLSNRNPADWLHSNAVAYNAELDQIVISSNFLSELWIIDHSTTTEEAAGHTGGLRGMGGDILYRWGNPEVYDRGTPTDRRLYTQHDTQWIPDGYPGADNILLFSNGNGRPDGDYSTIVEVRTSVDPAGNYPVPPAHEPHGPSEATWEYTATPPDSLYGANASGCQRLPNGNTLMIETPIGTLREIDSSGQEVWKYIFPVDGNGPMVQGSEPTDNRAFRTLRYAPDYAAFDGRHLTPGGTIEISVVQAMLTELVSSVTALDLPAGIEQSLLAKLDAAGRAEDRGNENAAGRQLRAFVNQVTAQRGHHIGEEDADTLIASAMDIMAMLDTRGGPFTGGGKWQPVLKTPDDTGGGIQLSASHPNPFDHLATIQLVLPQRSPVALGVYDVAGRLVRVLVDDQWPQGRHTVAWDGRDGAGLRVAGGTYFVKLTAGDVTHTRKVVFLGGQ